MQRDKVDFESYWLLIGCEDLIDYHVGCDFKPDVGALVIVDEADTFMLGSPAVFTTFIEANACICFTATPDNCDEKGAEAKLVQTLKFKRFHYMLENSDVDVDALL